MSADGCDDDAMTGEIHVLVTAPDGSLICGLGAPARPVNNGGILEGMTGVITLVSARIEDLMSVGAGINPTTGVNEVQRVDIGGSPGSGSFRLNFNGADTDNINHHPAAGDVQRALEVLPTVGLGNVLVTKDGNWGYVCSFQSELGNQNLPPMTYTNMLGGDGTITISTVTEGDSPSGPIQATSVLTGFGELLLTVRDSTGSEWTYRVIPAVSPDLCEVTFLGQLVSGTPQ
jgi:hypothetical protein